MSKSTLHGKEYRSAFVLYSKDGKRAVDVLEFRDDGTYLDEKELFKGNTFTNRHSGKLVGPFASPTEAEKFVVATSWFCGDDK